MTRAGGGVGGGYSAWVSVPDGGGAGGGYSAEVTAMEPRKT